MHSLTATPKYRNKRSSIQAKRSCIGCGIPTRKQVCDRCEAWDQVARYIEMTSLALRQAQL